MLFSEEMGYSLLDTFTPLQISVCGSDYHEYKRHIYRQDALEVWADISNTVAGQTNIEREIRNNLAVFDNQNVSAEIAKARKEQYIAHLLKITIANLYQFTGLKDVDLEEYCYYIPGSIQRPAVRKLHPLTGETLYPFLYAVSYYFCRMLDGLCKEQIPYISFYSVLKMLGYRKQFAEKFATQNELGQTGEYGGITKNPIPMELCTPAASCWLQKAVKAGFLDENYKPTEKLDTRGKQALFAEMFSEKTGIKCMFKPFETLWSVKRLRQQKYKRREITGKVNGDGEIIAFFE